MSAKKIIVNAVSIVIMLLSFVFIGYTFTKIDTAVFKDSISFAWITAAPILCVLYLLINVNRSFNWKLILEFLSSTRIKGFAVSGIYLRTEIAKYIPSNMVHFAGRHLLTRKMGFRDRVLVGANILDLCFLLAAASLIIFVSLVSGQLPLPAAVMKYVNLRILFAAGAFVAVCMVIYMFLKRKTVFAEIKPFLSVQKISGAVVICAMYMPVFIINSLILLAVLRYMCASPVAASAVIPVFASFTFAWTLGFVVPGAPGGLGVRESVLIILLAPYFGESAALSAALLSRIISILGDCAAFGLSYAKPFRY